MKRLFLLSVSVIILLTSATLAQQSYTDNDLYMKGYINAMLEERFEIKANVEVVDGEVFLPENVASHPEYEKIIMDISKIKSVKSIKLVDNTQMRRLEKAWTFTGDTLFKPLYADPRWPKFSASYGYFSQSFKYKHALDLNAGKQFSIYRFGVGEDIYTEIGFFAGAFMKFDMSSGSVLEVINADYQFGIPVSMQFNDAFTAMVRFYHQSSNIGYDFIEKKQDADLKYKKFNYEALDFLVSFNPNEWFRLYGGLGFIVNSTPSNFDRFYYHGGAEIRVLADNDQIPPLVIAIDVKGYQETDYTPSAGFKAGVEIFDRTLISLDVFSGKSPDGQFYKENVTSVGLGISFY